MERRELKRDLLSNPNVRFVVCRWRFTGKNGSFQIYCGSVLSLNSLFLVNYFFFTVFAPKIPTNNFMETNPSFH